MPFVKVHDIRVYYETAGRGPRLLYIGGSGGDLRTKPSVFDSPLLEHFEVLSFDQRGLGQTDKPDKPYTMADYGEDAAALARSLGWARYGVMGVSFGGMVAQEVALLYPDQVERAVFACSSPGGAGGASYPIHELQALHPEERARKQMGITDTRRGPDWQAEHPDEAQAVVAEALARRGVGADEPGHDLGYRRQLEARANHDTFDRLARLEMPVFICGGRFDMQAPPENQRAMQAQIRGSHLELFEGGHGFLREDPKAYERVVAFLLGHLEAGEASELKPKSDSLLLS